MLSDTDYCCHNTTRLEVLGGGCFHSWSDVTRYSKSCRWSGWTRQHCHKEMMEVYRVCLVSKMSCVVREFYNSRCHQDEPLKLCSVSKNSC